MVENYLKDVTSAEKTEIDKEIKISDFVKSISIGNGEFPADFDYKKGDSGNTIKKI